MYSTNYLISFLQMQGWDSTSVQQYEDLLTKPQNADASSLAFILILAFITGLLFLILFILFSQSREQKKLVSIIQNLSAEAEKKKQETLPDNGGKTENFPEPGGETVEGVDMPVLGGETVKWKDMPALLKQAIKENDELVFENIELHKHLQSLREELNAAGDTELFMRFLTQNKLSSTKEGVLFIAENGNQWLDEMNALQLKNDDTKISFYLFMKTLVDMAKKLMQDETFMDDVFSRYGSFIQNPGGLHVRDNKNDGIKFLKNSLELSVLFRDLIRRHNEPELFLPGKPQNINFEMLASGISPSQIDAPQNNCQYDGSDIPSNLLAYSLVCNMNGLGDLNVFISGDKIQKNIR